MNDPLPFKILYGCFLNQMLNVDHKHLEDPLPFDNCFLLYLIVIILRGKGSSKCS